MMKKIFAVIVLCCVVSVGFAGPPQVGVDQLQFKSAVVVSVIEVRSEILLTDLSWKEGTALSAITAVNFEATSRIEESMINVVEMNFYTVQTGLTRLQNKVDPFKPTFYLAQNSPPVAKVLLC
jgi:hypothetical protein